MNVPSLGGLLIHKVELTLTLSPVSLFETKN